MGNGVAAASILLEVGWPEVNYGRTPEGFLESVVPAQGLGNVDRLCTESNSLELNRTANEDYIDFLLGSINKIN